VKLIVKKDYDELSRYVANEIAECIRSNPRTVLCLPTGNTPVGVYRELTRMYKEGDVSFAQCVVFNLDEYYPIDPDDPNSYRSFMKHNLFDHVDLPPESANIPNGQAADPEAECERYEAEIRESGGIDLALLGIGRNGHIGFNEPGRELCLRTHVVTLTQSTLEANHGPFGSIEAMPKRALTMGIGSIMSAKRIIVIASGPSKRQAVEAMLSGKVTTDVPASLLQLHRDVTVVLDELVGVSQCDG
jgi:glucosamine-6-phosphate deaminase